ncbi:ATP-binding protein [Siminovitchia fortis]|uniref:histidine kinase n=1 Tax=Siminovitchia fortis TaxID=254758 RepID=A0A451GCR8_9BACI|nr:ATP-binding protein [Siminovitchia fortis]RWR13200.1 HAMP domain-containing protein [Siminovitchia fortis]WHY82017.1 ATP-binding protein [Siminovitchia fortis]
MHKLWVRITFSFLLLMFFALLGSGLFLANTMKNTYMDLKESQLKQTAHLILQALELEGIEQEGLQSKVKELSAPVTSRVTVIDRNGKVLADSEDDPASMENHLDRPEVKQVIDKGKESGISTRYSHTLGYSMMYAAIPVEINGEVEGVVRVALSLENIEKAIRHLRNTLTIVLLAALLLTALIGIRIAKGIAKPIEEMMLVSEKLKDKDYTARVRMQPKGELGQLANAINVLAASLKSQMEKIQENEQQLSGVLRNMMSGVLLVDKNGKILLANRAIGCMLNADPLAFTGKQHVEIVKNAGLSRLIDRCLNEQSEIRDEIQFYYPDERILDAHLAPYVGENGELKGIVAVLHDITDIRRLEKMRSEFIANVSHELKTPITSVKGFTETLLDGAMEDEEALHHFLGIIHKESERLHRLINDILHLSKIEQHMIPLEMENVNVAEVVDRVADTVRKDIEKKGLELLLPAEREIWVEGQKDRIQQIILNLVSNAVSYTPAGGKITVSITDRGDRIAISVKDTGIGIAKKDLPRLFERFYRVDKGRSRNSGGTGLGLAIVKHLVESHNGKIEVESEEGSGTEFTVILPKKQ